MGLIGKKVSEMTPEEVELLKEAAQALARCGERLEKALKHLSEAETHLDATLNAYNKHLCSSTGGPDIQGDIKRSLEENLKDAVTSYRKAWKKAEEARYMYIVQREAIGLRNHRFVDEVYPLPRFRKLNIP